MDKELRRESRRLKMDFETLKSVAQELKARGLTPAFDKEAESRFSLTITK